MRPRGQTRMVAHAPTRPEPTFPRLVSTIGPHSTICLIGRWQTAYLVLVNGVLALERVSDDTTPGPTGDRVGSDTVSNQTRTQDHRCGGRVHSGGSNGCHVMLTMPTGLHAPPAPLPSSPA